MPASRLSVPLLGLILGVVPGAAQIVVDDRVVETRADGPCVDMLTTGAQSYVDCGNGTVYDAFNDLLWLKDSSCDALGTLGFGDWLTAQDAAAGIAHGLDCDGDQVPDLTDRSQPGDWRLPTRREWQGLLFLAEQNDCWSGGTGGAPALVDDTGTGCASTLPSSFIGVEVLEYWSSQIDETDPSSAHTADLLTGEMSTFDRATPFAALIWPVRGGGSPDHQGAVVDEGAIVDTRSDPSCLASLSHLPERYRSCGDGTVYDAATGLLWLQDATCGQLQNLGPLGADWAFAKQQTALLEDGVCGLADGSQKGDWRLPTLDEWFQATDAATELGCGAPSLTDTSGVLCASEAPTPFIGLEDSVISEIAGYGFWCGGGAAEKADAFALVCRIGACPPDFLPFPFPLCFRCGVGGVIPKHETPFFAWPVREVG